jgi:S1-C subfamily serine protease
MPAFNPKSMPMSNASVLAILAVAAVVPLERGVAQDSVTGPDPVELRIDRGPENVMQFVMNRRARLGLKVNLRAKETDSVGAYVDAVTPNGPAAKAGIQSGDIITSIGGRTVLAGGTAESGARRESLPGLRLVELAARLAPNDTVPVEFRRGKDKKTVPVVTADEPDILFRGEPGGRSFAFRFGPNGPQRMAMPLEDEGGGQFGRGLLLSNSSVLAQLELAPLNLDLGRYFGATEGVLVISAPKNSALNLKGGDVVLTVDGRKPSTPSQLVRILSSYERDESMKIDVLRNHKRETILSRLGNQAER